MPGHKRVRQNQSDGAPLAVDGLTSHQVAEIVAGFKQAQVTYDQYPLALLAYIKAACPPGHRNLAYVLLAANAIRPNDLDRLRALDPQDTVAWQDGRPVRWDGEKYVGIPTSDSVGEGG